MRTAGRIHAVDCGEGPRAWIVDSALDRLVVAEAVTVTSTRRRERDSCVKSPCHIEAPRFAEAFRH